MAKKSKFNEITIEVRLKFQLVEVHLCNVMINVDILSEKRVFRY